MQNWAMRTTVNLDEETHYIVSNYAQGQGITMGEAIGNLARLGLESAREKKLPSRLKRLPNGMLIFAGQGRVLTDEMVKAALEDED
jgi:hypothetical protein